MQIAKRKTPGWLVALLAALFLLPLTACSDDDSSSKDKNSSDSELIGKWYATDYYGETSYTYKLTFDKKGNFVWENYFDDDYYFRGGTYTAKSEENELILFQTYVGEGDMRYAEYQTDEYTYQIKSGKLYIYAEKNGDPYGEAYPVFKRAD